MPEDVKIPEESVEPQTPAVEPAVPSEPQPDENETEEQKSVPLRALQEERERRQALQAELDIMKQIAGDQVLFDATGRPVSKTQTPTMQPSPDANKVSEEMEKLWESDPRKAVQMEIMSAMTWRDTLEANIDKQEIETAQKYSDYNHYRDTIRQYVRALPLEQRAKKGVHDLAYYVVKGQLSGSIYEKAQQDILKKIQAGEQVQGLNPGTTSAIKPVKGVKATPDQAAVAEMMGMTVEEYLAHQVKQGGAK